MSEVLRLRSEGDTVVLRITLGVEDIARALPAGYHVVQEGQAVVGGRVWEFDLTASFSEVVAAGDRYELRATTTQMEAPPDAR